jgi:hypothetical protein
MGAIDQALATTDAVQFNSAIVDSTSTEALLVRKESSGGDVFWINTSTDFIGIKAQVSIVFNNSECLLVQSTGGVKTLVADTNDNIVKIGGDTIIDTTSTEALLVRKDGDTGDVFTVDTTNSQVLVNGIVVEPTTGDITNTSFSGANNQVAASNVTGLLFEEASIKSFIIIATIKVDATSDLYQQIEIRGLQKASGTWVIADIRLGDDTDVEFTILSTGGNGQIQYTSSNYTGFSSLDITFRAWVN